MDITGFVAGPYKTNTYLLSANGRGVVIDPGMHAASRVDAWLAEKQLELDAVVLTHGHLDHTREAGDVAKKYSVPVYIHGEDAFMLDEGAGVSTESQILFDAKNMVPIDDLRLLDDGADFQIAGQKFRLVHAPGHSPGSVVFVGEEFAITGDVLFRGSIGRTDLQHSDPAAMDKSLATLCDALDDQLALLPGHGPTTTMRNERMTNPFLLNLRTP